MHPPAPGGEHAQPPVADLVPEALDDHSAVGREGAGRSTLLAQVGDEVARRALVKVAAARERGRIGVGRLADELTDRAPQLARSPGALTAPEGNHPGQAGRRRDDHPIVGDLFDPPGGRTEQKGLTGARLVNHLLIELADTAPVG
ncbi:hypothetical protein HRbin41_00858 [bacterium HR41]|nr:hypothetical protein HRbin41_00858 [bacterium HR41]